VCGIAGFTHLKKSADPDRIWEITRSLIHRGPDQQGVWESGEVSLGAVRLKIIDLELGDQPMASDDGDTVLAFNGELYNHMELRRELEQAGHRFHSRCVALTELRPRGSRQTGFGQAFCQTGEPLRGRDNSEFWLELQDLGGENLDIVARYQRVHLIEVAIAPNHIESIGSDRARRSQNGNFLHRGTCHFNTWCLKPRGKQMYSFS